MENDSTEIQPKNPDQADKPVTLNDLVKNKEAIAYLISIAGVYLPWIDLGYVNINGRNIGKLILGQMDINIKILNSVIFNANTIDEYIAWFILNAIDCIGYLPFVLGLMIYFSFKPSCVGYLKRLKPVVTLLTLLVCFIVIGAVLHLENRTRSVSDEVDMAMGFHFTWAGVVASMFFNGETRVAMRQILNRVFYFVGAIVLFIIAYSILTQAGPVK